MAQKGLSMADINEIKRLQKLGLSNRKIGKALGVHRNTINKYIEAEKKPQLELLENKSKSSWTELVDWESVRKEYLKGVALNVLHEELFSEGKVPVQYPGFWKQAKKQLDLSGSGGPEVYQKQRSIGDRCTKFDGFECAICMLEKRAPLGPGSFAERPMAPSHLINACV